MRTQVLKCFYQTCSFESRQSEKKNTAYNFTEIVPFTLQEMSSSSDKPLQITDTLDQSASSKDHVTPGKDQSTPYPTKSLIFADGKLKLWDGHW